MTQSSQIRNAITINAAFTPTGGSELTAATSYSIIFSKAADYITLLPINITDNGDGTFTSVLDSTGTIHEGIDPVDFATHAAKVSTPDTGYLGNNVVLNK